MALPVAALALAAKEALLVARLRGLTNQALGANSKPWPFGLSPALSWSMEESWHQPRPSPHRFREGKHELLTSQPAGCYFAGRSKWHL